MCEIKLVFLLLKGILFNFFVIFILKEVENWFCVIIRCIGFLGSCELFVLDIIGLFILRDVGGIFWLKYFRILKEDRVILIL